MRGSRTMLTWLEKMTHGRWWLLWSTGVPMLLTVAGALYCAHYLGEQRAEIARLSAELRACQAR